MCYADKRTPFTSIYKLQERLSVCVCVSVKKSKMRWLMIPYLPLTVSSKVTLKPHLWLEPNFVHLGFVLQVI